MLTKRTIIGNAVGGVITAIGIFSLISALGLQVTELNDTYGIGEFTAYEFYAPDGAHEFIKISGDTFDVKVQTPGTGLQVPNTPHKNEVSFDWVVLEDGINRIEIQNTGEKELLVTGTLEYQTDPILYAYHSMVIVAGIVIIGFSAGFSLRKPRGF